MLRWGSSNSCKSVRRRNHAARATVLLASAAFAIVAAHTALQAFCGARGATVRGAASRPGAGQTTMQAGAPAFPMVKFAEQTSQSVQSVPDSTLPMSDAEIAAYMQLSDVDQSEMMRAATLMDWIPSLTELTPQWILTYVFLPAFAFFLFNFLTTPIQDKIMGEKVEYDFSGKTSRIGRILAESGFIEGDPDLPPLPAEAPSDIPGFGKLEDVRRQRAETGGMEDAVASLRGKFEEVTGSPEVEEARQAKAKAQEAKQEEAKTEKAKSPVSEEARASS